MKKITFLILLFAMALIATQYTFAYTYEVHDDVLSSDSPYSITYTTESYDDDFNYLHIKLAPAAGYSFYGNYVMSMFNIFPDDRLAPFDTMYQDGTIGGGGIPSFISSQYVVHYNGSDEPIQSFKIAFYEGDPSRMMIRWRNIAAEDDYYIITLLLDATVQASTYMDSVMATVNDQMVRFSVISPEEYQIIYEQGYADALATIQAQYDMLLEEIIDVQEENTLLLSQVSDYESGITVDVMTNAEFISNNLAVLIIVGIVLIALGMYLGGSKKRSKYRKFY